MAESKVVEIYEHEIKASKIWKSYDKVPWGRRTSGEQCPPPEDIEPEGPDWTWECNWKIEKRAGFTDEEGWEYASKHAKFYDNGKRIWNIVAGTIPKKRNPKPEASSSDTARRRLWCRVMMKRDALNGNKGGGFELNKVIPRVQQGLTSIHAARTQIEEIIKQAPGGQLSQYAAPQMIQLTITVQKNANDLVIGLDQMEKQCKEDSTHQKHLAVIKKLRNDCIREQSALTVLANQLGIPPPGPQSGARFHQGAAGGGDSSSSSSSSSFPKRGSREWGGSRNDDSSHSNSSHNSSGRKITPVLSPSNLHTPEKQGGGSSGSEVVSSTKAGNIRGSLSITPNVPMNVPNLVSTPLGAGGQIGVGSGTAGAEGNNSDHDSATAAAAGAGDRGVGGASSWRGSRSLARTGSNNSTNNTYTEDYDPDDGVFVDRHQHELMIEQKLKPVDEATIMQDIIDERAVEIQKMHKGIIEVNEMFTDLSHFVKGQQFEIDAIFQNADEAAAKTKEAFEQVVQANQLQKDGNCVMC